MPNIILPSPTENNGAVLIHFHSEKFPYSKIQSFVLKRFDNIDVKTRTIDDHEDSFIIHGVSTVPTVIFIIEQKEQARWTTVVSYEDMRDTIDAYL